MSPLDTLEPDRGFVVATGIECSAPVVAGGVRQDELRLTGHWERFGDDAALMASMGIRWVRYGIPFHVVAADPDRFDWTWTDAALGALSAHGLEPIADLLHFGVPDDLAGVSDPRLPTRFLPFVRAFVERYPAIRHYTPVNEPFITAAFSCREGHWNERRRDERAQAAALVNLVRCVVEASEVIRSVHPDAVFLQSDGCERWIAGGPDTADEASLLNDLRFAGWELAYGRDVGPAARRWFVENGVGRDELRWFARGSDQGAIVGHDYYAGNERVLFAPGRSRVREPLEGYASLAREYHERLRLPFLLAETNREDGDAVPWLASVWNDMLALAADGYPVRGLCWYSLTDQVDWDTCLAEVNGHVNPLGLVDLDRRERSVAALFRRLVRDAAAVRETLAAARVARVPETIGEREASDGSTEPSGGSTIERQRPAVDQMLPGPA